MNDPILDVLTIILLLPPIILFFFIFIARTVSDVEDDIKDEDD